METSNPANSGRLFYSVFLAPVVVGSGCVLFRAQAYDIGIARFLLVISGLMGASIFVSIAKCIVSYPQYRQYVLLHHRTVFSSKLANVIVAIILVGIMSLGTHFVMYMSLTISREITDVYWGGSLLLLLKATFAYSAVPVLVVFMFCYVGIVANSQ